MSYKLIKNQLGGGDFPVLIVIAVIVVLWFFFVNSSKKSEKDEKKVTEKWNQYISSMVSSPETIASDSVNFKTRPAVDVTAPGVPYFEIPVRLAALRMKKDLKKKAAKKAAKRVAKKSAKKAAKRKVSLSSLPFPSSSVKSTPLSSVKSTPVSSARSTPVSSPKLTPVSSARSSPKLSSVSSARSTPVVSARSSPIVVPKMIPLLMKSSKKKVVEKMTNVNNLHLISDSYNLKIPLSKSVCSQKCCGYYWKGDNMDEMFKKNDPVKWDDVGVGRKFKTSNVTCMGDGVAPPGCRCYTNDQQNLLSTRGGNGSRQY